MTISVSMLAPVAGGVYIAKSGTTYTASAATKVVSSVLVGDIESLTNLGCIVVSEQAFNNITVSSAAGQYVAEGCINQIAASTMTVPLLLGALGLIGSQTTLVSLSTGNTTVTSSAASFLDEKSAAATVLTCGLGTAVLRTVGSTLMQLVSRSGGTSSAGAAYAYGITSS